MESWKILETKYLHPWFRIDTCELPNGSFLDAKILEFGTWANVVALTAADEVVLVRQYRHGVREVILETPGGAVEAGEDPMDGVKRELLEETGYTADKFILVGRLYPNPAIQTNTMYCYLALNAFKVKEQELDSGEDIEVHLVPLTDLIEMAKRSEFPHALDVAVLYQALAYLGRLS
jgi:8-oxo-dGTP pyrophosphatase MutT (NUDIX family)